jgi:hypothetical protein
MTCSGPVRKRSKALTYLDRPVQAKQVDAYTAEEAARLAFCPVPYSPDALSSLPVAPLQPPADPATPVRLSSREC